MDIQSRLIHIYLNILSIIMRNKSSSSSLSFQSQRSYFGSRTVNDKVVEGFDNGSFLCTDRNISMAKLALEKAVTDFIHPLCDNGINEQRTARKLGPPPNHQWHV